MPRTPAKAIKKKAEPSRENEVQPVITWLKRHSTRRTLEGTVRHLLGPRAEISGWSVPAAVGLASLLLALTLPMEYVRWSGWAYMSMGFLVPLQRRWQARSRTRRSKAAASMHP